MRRWLPLVVLCATLCGVAAAPAGAAALRPAGETCAPVTACQAVLRVAVSRDGRFVAVARSSGSGRYDGILRVMRRDAYDGALSPVDAGLPCPADAAAGTRCSAIRFDLPPMLLEFMPGDGALLVGDVLVRFDPARGELLAPGAAECIRWHGRCLAPYSEFARYAIEVAASGAGVLYAPWLDGIVRLRYDAAAVVLAVDERPGACATATGAGPDGVAGECVAAAAFSAAMLGDDIVTIGVDGSGGAVRVLHPDPATGALAVSACIGAGPGCSALTWPAARGSGSTNLAVTADGSRIYALLRGTLRSIARDPATGALGGLAGCVGDADACAHLPTRQGMGQVALAPDGSTLHVVSETSLTSIPRAADGALRLGDATCVEMQNTTAHRPCEVALGVPRTLELSPDGRSGYGAGHERIHLQVGAPPRCSALAATAWHGAPLTLAPCADVNGDVPTYAAASPFPRGTRVAAAPDGALVVVPQAPRGARQRLQVAATDVDGRSAPFTVDLAVRPTPSVTISPVVEGARALGRTRAGDRLYGVLFGPYARVRIAGRVRDVAGPLVGVRVDVRASGRHREVRTTAGGRYRTVLPSPSVSSRIRTPLAAFPATRARQPAFILVGPTLETPHLYLRDGVVFGELRVKPASAVRYGRIVVEQLSGRRVVWSRTYRSALGRFQVRMPAVQGIHRIRYVPRRGFEPYAASFTVFDLRFRTARRRPGLRGAARVVGTVPIAAGVGRP